MLLKLSLKFFLRWQNRQDSETQLSGVDQGT